MKVFSKNETRKYKKNQEFRKSLIYDENYDKYISEEGKEFIRCNDRYDTKKSGYVSMSKVYRCFDWNKDGQKTKGIYIAETFQKYRKESLENITSDQGIVDIIAQPREIIKNSFFVTSKLLRNFLSINFHS